VGRESISHEETIGTSVPRSIRCSCAPTIRAGVCTPSTKTSPGCVRSKPARSRSRWISVHPVWLHPTEAEKHASSTGISSRSTTSVARYWEAHTSPSASCPVWCISITRQVGPDRPRRDRSWRRDQHHRARNTTSKNAVGHAVSGFLVQIEKTDMEALKRKYPEAFERPFHPCAGPGLEACILGGE